jgi:RND family efflux transporter MFP subunit
VTTKADQLAELRIDRDDEPTHKSRVPLVIAALLVVGVVIAFSIKVLSNRPVAVTVETVRAAQGGAANNSVLDASGYVVARRQATVSSEISGKVLEVLVEEGMVIEANQIVAYLEDSQQKAYLALSQAELVSAKARIKETEARIVQADLDLARYEELAERNLTSKTELDAARANAQTFRARLEAGRESVTVAERSVDVSRDQLDKTIIRAPFAGVVVSKNAQPGEMISPNSAGGGFTRTGICTIVDMDSLEIEVDVNEAYIQRVRQGQPVTATLDAYQDWKIPAEVIAIVPTADRQKATVRVRIGFLEKDGRVLRDMGVKVAFLDDPTESVPDKKSAAVYVSDDALNTDSDGNFVWIVRDQTAVRRAVTVGQRSARGVQILQGLGPGDKVINSSGKPLEQGERIEQKLSIK